MTELTPKDMERARFAFDIYDFEGKARVDLFYLGDCLRGLNLNPTLKMIEKLGGTKKKGEKFLKLEEFYPIYSDVKKSKETGNFEDFIECLKLYDKMEREEVDILIKECCDPEDDDGFIPYEPFLRRVCRAPPRDVRGLVIPGQPAQSLLQQRKQLSVNTTFNYQLQLAVSTTT